jgi:aspartyl-tRNA(Asn)/glutamyl-tRNA(Gln) amidotransferase subunit B
VEAWTLEWDEDNQSLKKMRSKETEADYRYFREPDLLSVRVDPAWRSEILSRLPELPLARYERFIAQYHLPVYDAAILTEERSLSDYFEEAVRQFGGEPKIIANWVQNEVLRLLKESNQPARALGFSPAHLAELARLVEDRTITRQTAVALIPKVMASGQTPRAIVATEGLAQISGDEAVRELARQVVAENPKEVEAYRAKPSLLKWFVGQVMRKSKGQANAQMAEKLLKDILGE